MPTDQSPRGAQPGPRARPLEIGASDVACVVGDAAPSGTLHQQADLAGVGRGALITGQAIIAEEIILA